MYTMNPIHDYLVYIKYEVYLDRMNLVGKTYVCILLLEFQGLRHVCSLVWRRQSIDYYIHA